jgi:hypothetical protein
MGTRGEFEYMLNCMRKAEVLSSTDIGAEEAGGCGVENGLFSKRTRHVRLSLTRHRFQVGTATFILIFYQLIQSPTV